MENLTKTQLVLLTLLVSFVTSIATGIMTVSLLQGTSSNVSQTINRVVEKTIERVVETPSGAKTIKEVQVVSEDDRITAAIARNTASLVRIKVLNPDGSSSFYAIGIIVSKDGEIIAERTSAFASQFGFSATFPDGTISNLALARELSDVGAVLFKAAGVPATGISPAVVSKALPKLGQTVVVLEGQNDNFSLVGRVTNLQGESSTTPRLIDTDIRGGRETAGAPLIDLSGDVLGIRRSDVPGGRVFIYAPLVFNAASR